MVGTSAGSAEGWQRQRRAVSIGRAATTAISGPVSAVSLYTVWVTHPRPRSLNRTKRQ